MKKTTCRLLSFVLITVMAFSLFSCGQDPKGTVTSKENADDGQFSLGENSGNIYSNDFLGIGCEFGSEWHLYSQEEIDELNKQSVGLFSEEIAKEMEDEDWFYDMMARIDNTGSSVNIIIKKISLAESLANVREMVKASKDQIVSEYGKMGCTDIEFQVGERNFAGGKTVVSVMTSKLNGTDFYIKQLHIIKGRYYAVITAGSFVTDTCDDTLDMFYKLK